MDDGRDAGFEDWFSALRRAPEAAAALTAIFDSLSDSSILDLFRNAGVWSSDSSGSEEDWDWI